VRAEERGEPKAAPGVEMVGVGAGAGAGTGIWRGTARRLVLVACSSCVETIGRELQLRHISNDAASSKQPGSPHLFFSEAWSWWCWLATRGAEAETDSCKS
jgi:hypothetical protein